MGADIVTIAAFEVAGHPGPDGIGTIVLANKASQMLNIPLLAAGGIADGRGLVAALALGASGVTMGTRFVASKECIIHSNHKEWIVQANENDSALCPRSIKNMVRVANNSAAKKCLEMEAKGSSLEELMKIISGKNGKACYENGNVDGGLFPVGPSAGLIDNVKSVQDIIDDIMTEAEATILKLNAQNQ
jgi:nitronate monooxygenase